MLGGDGIILTRTLGMRLALSAALQADGSIYARLDAGQGGAVSFCTIWRTRIAPGFHPKLLQPSDWTSQAKDTCVERLCKTLLSLERDHTPLAVRSCGAAVVTADIAVATARIPRDGLAKMKPLQGRHILPAAPELAVPLWVKS
jgi:hypothetical protein